MAIETTLRYGPMTDSFTPLPKVKANDVLIVKKADLTELRESVSVLVNGLDMLGDFPDSASISPKLTIGQLRAIARALAALPK